MEESGRTTFADENAAPTAPGSGDAERSALTDFLDQIRTIRSSIERDIGNLGGGADDANGEQPAWSVPIMRVANFISDRIAAAPADEPAAANRGIRSFGISGRSTSLLANAAATLPPLSPSRTAGRTVGNPRDFYEKSTVATARIRPVHKSSTINGKSCRDIRSATSIATKENAQMCAHCSYARRLCSLIMRLFCRLPPCCYISMTTSRCARRRCFLPQRLLPSRSP